MQMQCTPVCCMLHAKSLRVQGSTHTSFQNVLQAAHHIQRISRVDQLLRTDAPGHVGALVARGHGLGAEPRSCSHNQCEARSTWLDAQQPARVRRVDKCMMVK